MTTHCLNLLHIKVYIGMHYYHLRMVVYNSVWSSTHTSWSQIRISCTNTSASTSIARSNRKSQMKYITVKSRVPDSSLNQTRCPLGDSVFARKFRRSLVTIYSMRRATITCAPKNARWARRNESRGKSLSLTGREHHGPLGGCCYVSRDFIIRTPLKHLIY